MADAAANYNVTPWADLSTMPARWLAQLGGKAGQHAERASWATWRPREQRIEDQLYWAGLMYGVELTIGDRLLAAEAPGPRREAVVRLT